MKDYKKFNIQIKQGRHIVFEAETPVKAAVKLKQLCPSLSSYAILTRVYSHINPKPSNRILNGEVLSIRDINSKIGGVYHLKLVLKHNPLLDMNELDLVLKYKSSNIMEKDKIFSEMIRRYEGFLIGQANRLFTKIPIHYFAFDFEDCKGQSYYCLKLALDYFDLGKTTVNFEANKFSISYYVGRQMDARISSYWYKYNKKQKRGVEYDTYDFQVQGDDGHNYSEVLRDRRNMEAQCDSRFEMDALDSKLCDIQKKIKNYLMEGLKETKIRTKLNLKESEYLRYKDQLKSNMISVGLGK